MRHALDVVHAGDSAPPERPGQPGQPGLEQLPALFERLDGAGLPVRLTIRGEPGPLPAPVAAAVYRIVQEALTNTLGHAGATRAEVVLGYHPGMLRLRISDDGRSAGRAVILGHGIVGMWQRAALLGGDLSVAPRSAAGFQVTARFPVNGHRE
jgi:signal transduction histidine kinase